MTVLRFARIHLTIVTPTPLEYFVGSLPLPHRAFHPFAVFLQLRVHLCEFVSMPVDVHGDGAGSIRVWVIFRSRFVAVGIAGIKLPIVGGVEGVGGSDAVDALFGILDVLVHFGSAFLFIITE